MSTADLIRAWISLGLGFMYVGWVCWLPNRPTGMTALCWVLMGDGILIGCLATVWATKVRRRNRQSPSKD